MFASQECNPSRNKHLARWLLILTIFIHHSLQAADTRSSVETGCDDASVTEHVLDQMRVFGPDSQKHEFFGFVYRVKGELASAVVRSSQCRLDQCTIDTAAAARKIPKGAKILGEWHTHPHSTGSRMLSKHDVTGARNNSHLRCYAAFYATPEGEVHSWDPGQTSVPAAMASRMQVGNYHENPGQPAASAVASLAEGSPAE